MQKKLRLGCSWKNEDKNIFNNFFKCSLNFRVHAVQSELTKVSIANFVKFRFQSMSSTIEQAFEKITKCSPKKGPKIAFIRQLKGP